MAFRLNTGRLMAGLAVLWLSACGQEVERPNVLLVSVDTLRRDRLGAEMPALDQLEAASVVFEEARASSSWTLPALASLMTGHAAPTHGCFDMHSRLDESFVTLAERLAAAGYATAGVASHVFLKSKYGLSQGFEHYDESLALGLVKSHEAISSPGVTERALGWLDERAAAGDSRPFFLWAHYFDPHEVYREHAGFSERYGTETEAERYRGEVSFTDAWLGRLLAGLDARGLADETIVVFVADHGEEFADHGATRHGHTLYDELVRVPLVLRVPAGAGAFGGQLPPAVLDTPASQVDLLPTLLELCDVAPGPGELAGTSLVPAMRGERPAPRPQLMDVRLRKGRGADAIVLDGWKLIRHRDGERAGQSDLFELAGDPLEQHPVADAERKAALGARLDELLEEAERRAAAFGRAPALELDAAALGRLADLGYIDDGANE